MATTSSIGTSGRDYSTPQAWWDAFATGGWIGECYNDSEFTATAQTTFSGKATSATDYATLKCAAGQSFSDNANVRSNALRYNAADGVGMRKTNSYSYTLNVDNSYVTISGIQITAGTSTYPLSLSTGRTNMVLEYSIVEQRAAAHAIYADGSGKTRNCLIVNRSASSSGIHSSYGTWTHRNLVIVRPSDVAATGSAFNGGGTADIKNCAGFGFTNFSSTASGKSGSNNCSDATISFGTSNQASKTYANQFEVTTDATRDFRAKAGADLLNNGVTDTTNVPAGDDISRLARPQGSAWDIGPWELSVSAQQMLGMMVL